MTAPSQDRLPESAVEVPAEVELLHDGFRVFVWTTAWWLRTLSIAMIALGILAGVVGVVALSNGVGAASWTVFLSANAAWIGVVAGGVGYGRYGSFRGREMRVTTTQVTLGQQTVPISEIETVRPRPTGSRRWVNVALEGAEGRVLLRFAANRAITDYACGRIRHFRRRMDRQPSVADRRAQRDLYEFQQRLDER